jgi:hypothetical protein
MLNWSRSPNPVAPDLVDTTAELVSLIARGGFARQFKDSTTDLTD